MFPCLLSLSDMGNAIGSTLFPTVKPSIRQGLQFADILPRPLMLADLFPSLPRRNPSPAAAQRQRHFAGRRDGEATRGGDPASREAEAVETR